MEDTHSIIINKIQPVNHAQSHGLQYEIRSINATTSDRFLRRCVSRSIAGIMQRTINSYAVLRPLDRQEFQWIRDPIRSSRVGGWGVPAKGRNEGPFFFLLRVAQQHVHIEEDLGQKRSETLHTFPLIVACPFREKRAQGPTLPLCLRHHDVLRPPPPPPLR